VRHLHEGAGEGRMMNDDILAAIVTTALAIPTIGLIAWAGVHTSTRSIFTRRWADLAEQWENLDEPQQAERCRRIVAYLQLPWWKAMWQREPK
jgi:hypothetical protein